MVAVCGLAKYITMQIFLFMIPSMVSLCIIAGIKPLETILDNRLEAFNCITVMLISYCLMTFTPLAIDPMARYTMGFVMFALTILDIAVNIVLVAVDPIKKISRKCKVCYRKRDKLKSSCIALYIKLKECCCKGRKNRDRFDVYATLERKLATINEQVSDEESELDSDEEV